MDKRLTMSTKEIDRLEVLQRLGERRITQLLAAEQLGISVRQVKRLWKRYRERGVEELISRRRGKPSNHRLLPAAYPFWSKKCSSRRNWEHTVRTMRGKCSLIHSCCCGFGRMKA